jgi:putative ABC transport system permease protein
MFPELFNIVLKYIRKRKTRSFLTIIGILIGIASVVTLISLGQGLENAIDYQFAKLGSNKISISPAGSLAGPMSSGRTTAKLTEDDVKVIKKVKGVEFAMGMYASSKQVYFGKERFSIPIIALDSDAETMKYVDKSGLYEIDSGRNFRPGERYKTIIGSKVADGLYHKNVNIGDTLIIDGLEFQVIGIQKAGGSPMMDMMIRIPKDTLREMDGKTDEVSMINAVADEGADVSSVSEKIKQALLKYRDEKKGQESFTVQTTLNLIESFVSIIAVIQALLVGIAGISLVVGAVGIMNTMYTSVLERTRDIGVMKSIGAKEHDILAIFLLEAGILGAVGGAVGVALGAAGSYIVSYIAFFFLKTNILRISIGPLMIFGPLIFSFLIGAASGLFPAIQASHMKPVDSLRYE